MPGTGTGGWWAWVVTNGTTKRLSMRRWFQCPHGLELLPQSMVFAELEAQFQCPHGLELLLARQIETQKNKIVSMPSWAWVVTFLRQRKLAERMSFNALMGLSCHTFLQRWTAGIWVSMPSWAWVVTARMSNILNFSWYFLCIPAIYRCILAYLPIFFNQLSKFLRCESPSTFLGTCLSHHSFIIFLVTNTNTLLSGLYLISTPIEFLKIANVTLSVNALSGLSCYSALTWFLPTGNSFNALSGLSCYARVVWQMWCRCGFNALSGLSCYWWGIR